MLRPPATIIFANQHLCDKARDQHPQEFAEAGILTGLGLVPVDLLGVVVHGSACSSGDVAGRRTLRLRDGRCAGSHASPI